MPSPLGGMPEPSGSCGRSAVPPLALRWWFPLIMVTTERPLEGIEVCHAQVQAGLSAASRAQRRALMEPLLDRVMVSDSAVELCYVFPTSRGSLHRSFYQLRLDYRGGGGVAATGRPAVICLRECSRFNFQSGQPRGRTKIDPA